MKGIRKNGEKKHHLYMKKYANKIINESYD